MLNPTKKNHITTFAVIFWGFLGGIALSATQKIVPMTAHIQSMDKISVHSPHFIKNKGQTDHRVKFYIKGSGYTSFFTEEGVYMTLAGKADEKGETPSFETQTLKLFPVGAPKNMTLVAEEKQDGIVNHYVGSDPKRWKTNIPTYGRVRYKEVYPGVEMVFYGNDRELEYDLVVHPGADLSKIQMGYEGIDGLKITPSGDLEVLLKKSGSIFQKRPVIYQNINGLRHEIEGRFRLYKTSTKKSIDTAYGFEVASYNNAYPLLIDPVFVYSTYLGGSQEDIGYAIAVDGSRNTYVAGSTLSTSFPGTSGTGPFGTLNGNKDIFVTKMDATGTSTLYSTYIGGSGDDIGYGIAVDSAGNLYLTGETGSSNFSVTRPAFTAGGTGRKDAIIVKLNPDGSRSYSAALGGEGDDIGRGIAIDSTGTYITGETYSVLFPTMNPLQPALSPGGASDAFVTKINLDGSSLVYSTYLGGGGDIQSNLGFDEGFGIAVDSDGAAYVTGQTSSDNFKTTTSAHQPVRAGLVSDPIDAFLTKIAASGASVLYSTYFGGAKADRGRGIALMGKQVYLVGSTNSTNFPKTASPLKATLAQDDPGDAFIAKIDTDSSGTTSLLYSTYLGGGDVDEGYGVAVSTDNFVYVTGRTNSNDLPTTAPPQAHHGGGSSDIFVVRMNAAGSPSYATYLGGSGADFGYAVAVDSQGAAYVTGETKSFDYFTVSPFQKRHAGQSQVVSVESSPEREAKFSDVFVTKIALGAPDVTPPTVEIERIIPANGETSPSLKSTTIRATFSEPINPNIVSTPDAFKITDSDGRTIKGTLTYDVTNKEVTFKPDATLPESKTYTVVISTAVEDLAGNKMAADFTWNFSTSALPAPPPPGKKKGFCFIATAAYGSYLDPHVIVLRAFRDDYLLTNGPGRLFVDFYYTVSPPMADYIRAHEGIRTAVRWGLTPIVFGAAYPGISLLIFFVAGVGIWVIRRRRSFFHIG